MFKIYNLVFVFLFLCLSAFVTTPKVNVTAHVLDSEKLIPFAEISVNNGKEIVKADELGFFSLSLEKGKEYTLKVSAKGYKTVKQKAFKAEQDMDIRFTLIKN